MKDKDISKRSFAFPAIAWWHSSQDKCSIDVTVNGKKQGVTSKNIDKPEAR